ncbi:flagellar biosynthesis protein FlgB [Thioclava sp. BHET1]|nr:flagellar biosynthesis protein FlgB [Thioclava sp. BHET1]
MSPALPAFLQFADADLTLREQRQSLVASNISNADTPGYHAKDIDFERDLSSALEAGRAQTGDVQYRVSLPNGLDGNDVSMTAEKLESLKNVTAMKSEVTYLHQATSDLITALKPNPNGI